jgi:hypothetical protein
MLGHSWGTQHSIELVDGPYRDARSRVHRPDYQRQPRGKNRRGGSMLEGGLFAEYGFTETIPWEGVPAGAA